METYKELGYEKPKIVRLTGNDFPIDILEKHTGQKVPPNSYTYKGREIVCRQCSYCHSCR